MGRRKVEIGIGSPIRSHSGNPIGQPFGWGFDLYRTAITTADSSPSSLPIYEDTDVVRMADILVKGDFSVAGSVTLKFFNAAKEDNGGPNLVDLGDAEMIDEEKTLSFDTGQSIKQFTINQFGGSRLKVMVSSFSGTGSIDIYIRPAQ